MTLEFKSHGRKWNWGYNIYTFVSHSFSLLFLKKIWLHYKCYTLIFEFLRVYEKLVWAPNHIIVYLDIYILIYCHNVHEKQLWKNLYFVILSITALESIIHHDHIWQCDSSPVYYFWNRIEILNSPFLAWTHPLICYKIPVYIKR